MKATVIIPTYNRPERLVRLLQCLARQQGECIEEVLVCDDGSSTNTRGVLEPFYFKIPGLRLLWQEDWGFRAGQARNLGIRVAKGSILVFIDDDVLLPENFISAHLAAHRIGNNGHSSQKVVLGYRFRSPRVPEPLPPRLEEIVKCIPDDRIEQIGTQGEKLDLHSHPWFFVYSCNFSVPTDRIRVQFDEQFVGWGMEDIELGYRLVRSGYKVKVEPQASVLHIESATPRDPFICADRGLPPKYDSYIRNMVQFIDKYPEDRNVYQVLAADLRWYVRDKSRNRWIKDGYEHSPDSVIAEVHDLTGISRRIQPSRTLPQEESLQVATTGYRIV